MGVSLVVAVTDGDWFEFVRQRPQLAEVNFWAPSSANFRALDAGELFLFKLHSPRNFIVGGGIYTYSNTLPWSLAWEAFGEANGAASAEQMRRRIAKYRRADPDDRSSFTIGCRILSQPFFLEESQWIPVPASWSPNIVSFKTYTTETVEGRDLWNEIMARRLRAVQTEDAPPAERYGDPVLVRPRLGQGAFRVMVTDSYERRCAMTSERTLPALEAAHIRPYSDGGQHAPSNGLLLRRDLHALFDGGYVTVTPELKVEVSKRIKEEFENGKHYYALHGQSILVPKEAMHRPDKAALEWHNEERFRPVIIYQATKDQFIHHATRDDIEDVVARHFRSATGHGVSPSEIRAWKESLQEMSKVLQDPEIPGDVGIGIEYQVPRTSKRIDFIIAGEDQDARAKVVIVELKQWSTTRRSDKDAIVWARRGGPKGETEGLHPSYQAWTYAALLEDFNAAVQDNAIALRPCAYLHNHLRDGEIDHPHYEEHLERAPLFLKKERAKLQAFIRQHVRHGDRKGALYAIENGRLRPSKMLADSVVGLLQGHPEFILIDEQKLVQESVLAADARAASCKQVLIVQGGPGTGKSVLAINLLGALIGRGRNVRYVSKNAAPRAVYETRLTGTFKKTRISNLFSGSGSFVDVAQDTYDTLIVDEAHRLNEKSGLYRNLGENQIVELIRAARCTVFFVDDRQRVTLHDIGHSDALRKHALAAGAEVTELELSSQFRCNGSDGYLAWIDQTLEIHPTANQTLEGVDYDFRVFDNPADMHALVELRNGGNRARVVAGYCWKWPSKKDPSAWDIDMPEFGYRRRWNLDKDGSLWIVTPGSVDEVGCIHTCQGLELDYVGVIIGPDLIYRDGRVQVDVNRRASSDQSVKGLKKIGTTDPERASTLAEMIVKNTYRTLMTRGMKGCYVYCADAALAEHLRRCIGQTIASNALLADVDQRDPLDGVPLRRLPAKSAGEGARAVPVIDLGVVQQRFVDQSQLEAAALGWVELPSWVSPLSGMFVARSVAVSALEERGGGDWYLFRAAYLDADSALTDPVNLGPTRSAERVGEILTVLPSFVTHMP